MCDTDSGSMYGQSITVDQMNIRLAPRKTDVIKDRQSAGIGAGVLHHGIVDEESAGDQVSRHLHPHTANTFIGGLVTCAALISER